MKTGHLGNFRLMTVVLFGTLFVFSAAAPLLAQSSGDFSSLQKHINKQVTVEAQDGQVTGQLLRVEASRLVVYEAGTPKPIARELVTKVTRHKSRHTAAWVAGMSAAGLGTGFLIGFRSFDDATNSNAKVGASAGAGAGAGAAAGYALSRIGKQDQVVYQKE
jgi:hypothetical protein